MLHVSTGGAHQGFDGMLSYCASKAALRSVYESAPGRARRASPALSSASAGRGGDGDDARPRGGAGAELVSRVWCRAHASHWLIPAHRSRTRTTSFRDPRLISTGSPSDAGGGRHHRGGPSSAQQPGNVARSSRSSSTRRATTSSGRRTGTLGMRRTTAGGREMLCVRKHFSRPPGPATGPVATGKADRSP